MALATRTRLSHRPLTTRTLLESLEPRQLLSGAPSAFFTLATFDGTNGSHPAGHIAIDAQGNIFGATLQGGTTNATGTLYEIPSGTSTIVTLANFTGPNGQTPIGDLRFDSAGNLWGVTELGGATNNGTIFELPAGSSTPITVASFNKTNGATPLGGLVFDSAGNLYGTTQLGGPTNAGTVFELPAGSATPITLASFTNTNGSIPLGSSPIGALVRDAAGNLFGATPIGGAFNGGTIFEIHAGTSTITTLHDFSANNPVSIPSGLALDSAGNLFGVTQAGGTNNDGTLFEIPAGTATFLTRVNFDGTNTGSIPLGGLTFDSAGNLFGTASNGSANNYGAVYELPAGASTLQLLATFPDSAHGIHPVSLAFNASGHLFGTTAIGGNNDNGTVFAIAPTPFVADHLVFAQPPLHAFPNTPIAPAVTVYVEDAYGHLVTTDNSQIILTLVTAPAGVGLGGTRILNATNGVATFSDLTLAQVGSYTMAASDGTLTPAFSAEFTVGSLPLGYLDSATRSTIVGWGFDADTTPLTVGGRPTVFDPTPVLTTLPGAAPATLRIDIDGTPVATFPADLFRADLSSYAPVGSPNHGFQFATPVLSPDAHTINLLVQDAPGSTFVLVASKNIPAITPAFGNLEFADRSQIVGWAFSPTLGTTSATARIDIDGVPGTPFTAATPRADLTAYAPIGSPNHGFTYIPPALSMGAHTVNLLIQDPTYGNFTLAATSTITAVFATNNSAPIGAIDIADRTHIIGWGHDNDVPGLWPVGVSPGPGSAVRVDIDGVPGTPFIAGDNRPDLTAYAPVGSPNHGFTIDLAAAGIVLASGTHTVDLYVLDAPTTLFTLVAEKIIPALYPTSAATPFGNLEVHDRTQIIGWAFDADAGASSILVRIDIDGIVGTPIAAALPRPDLTAYAPVGSPNHGFNFTVPALSAPLHLVTVWIENVPTNTFTQLASFTI